MSVYDRDVDRIDEDPGECWDGNPDTYAQVVKDCHDKRIKRENQGRI